MDKRKKLGELSVIFGRCAVAVYNDCKARRVALSLVEKLVDSCTKVGGYIEGILINGDDGERSALAANEIYKARYTAKIIGDNKLCREKTVRDFLISSSNLLHGLLDPEPVQTNKNSNVKPVKTRKKAENFAGSDPDGFEDDFIEPAKRK